MNKQEEIREGIAIWLYNHEMSGGKEWWQLWLDLPEGKKYEYRCYALNLTQKLHSQGVVLLEERVQRYSEKTGEPVEPTPYKILTSLVYND